MATTVTSIGPIGARQINNNLYVGQNDLTTIQAAVTVAAKNIGIFTVIIPPEYAGTDTIATVTGGANNIQIIDQRLAQSQVFIWNGVQFVAEAFIQDSGFISLGPPAYFPQGSAAFYFYPAGTSGVGTAHLDFYANPGQGMPALNIVGNPSDGTPLWTFLRCDYDALKNPRLQIPSAVEVYTPAGMNNYNMWIGANRDLAGAQGMSIWGRPSANAIDLQGETLQDDSTSGTYNQAIRLNFLGGNVLLGPVVTVDPLGNITGVNHLTAVDAQFATCEVANSPVRTFANSPDTEGPSFPPAGIGISTGTAWDIESIDPATLATWPPAGIAVSTGTAWDTPINAADLAHLSLANIFTAAQTVQGNLTVVGNTTITNIEGIFRATANFGGGTTAPTGGGLQIGWNLANGVGETDFINSHAAVGGGFYWYNVAPGTAMTSATPTAMTLDSAANLINAGNHTTGTLTARGGLLANGFIPTPSAQAGIYAGLGSDAQSPVITWIDAGAPADAKVWTAVAFANSTLNFLCFNDALTANNPWMTVTRVGAVPSLISLNAAIGVSGMSNLSGGLVITGFGTASLANALHLGSTGGLNYFDSLGPSATVTGTTLFRGVSSNSSIVNLLLTLAPTGITAAIPFNAAAGTVSAGLSVGGGAAGATANTLRLWTQSSGATYLDFLGASSSSQASFQMRSSTSGGETVSGVLLCYSNLFSILVNTTVTGNFYASGTITSGGAKGFRITHPLDDTKDLMHVAVEGPECAVFYRGESVTAGGWAEVSLPDYFEALTMPTDRTVQLTTLFEEDDEPIGPMAASRVKDGKFRVWSAVPAQKFYWEVKAVRADIAPLEVKIDRGTQHTGGEKNDEGTDRIGAREN